MIEIKLSLDTNLGSVLIMIKKKCIVFIGQEMLISENFQVNSCTYVFMYANIIAHSQIIWFNL